MNGRGAAARTLVVALALSVAPAADADAPTPRRYAAAGTVEIAFTPGDAVDNLIVAAIDRAQTEVLVHAYTFTHRKIAQALINARRRGVAVAVLADREQARAVPQNVLAQLASGGIEVWLDGNFAAAHNKVIVIDAGLPHATTITGSYNFTLAAQRSNAENIVVLHDNEPVARAYRDNWRRLKAGATPWSEDALK
ncbi:MAG: phospholipase D family protein [Betaproteobacteria bacterium]|nr:MAG: phospholipase D family protein [Betaproteobacteria bacterium]TMH49562.1 MAG: phospholipase D family protein [Betaproteobacteria bacterium]